MFELNLSKVTFEDWVGTRDVPTLGSNVGSRKLPFQSWKSFKEAFAPEIVQRAICETPGKIHHLVDPFGGSGTSALVAQFMGVSPTIIEVNPFLADLIRAKLTSYDVEGLIKDYVRTMDRAHSRCKPFRPTFPGSPPTFVEPGVDGRYIFSKSLTRSIRKTLFAIDRLRCARSKRLFRVLLGATAVELSNIVISGKGRRYKRNWESNQSTPEQLLSNFSERVLAAIEDISRFGNRAHCDSTVVVGDARTSLSSVDSIDVSVFSPPYPNSFDYTDVYNVELWILGYFSSGPDNRVLRESTLRSHVQIKRDFSSRKLRSRTLSCVLNQLRSAESELWNKNIPDMISAYFDDMYGVLNHLGRALRKRGRVYCVVGDSKYAEIKVPVAKILTQITRDAELKLVDSERFRSMRSSPQQGGQEELPETLLVFEKH